MKIRDAMLVLLASGVVATSGILIAFAADQVSRIKGVTSEASSEELVVSATSNLEDIAVGIRDSLDNQMKNQYEMVGTWAKVPTIVDATTTAQQADAATLFEAWSAEQGRKADSDGEVQGDGNPENDVVPAASRFLTQMSKDSLYPEVFLTEGRGYVIAAGQATSDFDQGPDDLRFFLGRGLVKHKPEPGGEGWYRQANAAKSGLYVGDVSWDASSKSWGVEIVHQVKDPVSGARLGTLKAVFDYGRFVDRFVQVSNLGVAEIKVVDRKGTVVATSLKDKSKVNNEKVSVASQPFFAASQGAQKAGHEVKPLTDENGNSVYVGYAVSSDVNGHVIVVSKSREAVVGPIDAFSAALGGKIAAAGQSLQRNMLLVGIGVGCLVILVGFLVLRAKITVPIKKLTEVSEKLARADIEGLEIEISGNDEIAQFGESFKGVLAAFNQLMEDAESSRK